MTCTLDINPSEAISHANKAFGGTMSQGAFTVKDKSDLIEYTTNQVLLSKGDRFSPLVNAMRAIGVVTDLEKVVSKLPTQTVRDHEQEQFQQFSTPPTLGYLMAWAANLSPNDVMLEPSAGVGGLAVFGLIAGCKVIANELAERRYRLLQKFNLHGCYNENAEQLHNVLPVSVRPTIVVMNPPYSATAGRTGDKKVSHTGLRHVEQALLRLVPGGRLVALLPASREGGTSNTMVGWFNEIGYAIRANIGFPRTAYAKFGTNFPVRIVVIDKTAPDKFETVVGEVTSLVAAIPLLNKVREVRNVGVHGNAGNGNQTSHATVSEVREKSDLRNSDSSKQHPARKLESRDSDVRSNTGNVQTPTKELGIHAAEARQLSPMSDAIFEPYTPQRVLIDGAKEHPTPLVQSAAMASVLPPAATYAPCIPQELVDSGALSNAQLEAIVYAGQSFREYLPTVNVEGKDVRYRRGWFCGDSTGTGKGRILSGTIIDSFARGCRKAIWISATQSLIRDAIRDWTDLGGDEEDVINLSRIKLDNKIPNREGKSILFATYALLGVNATPKINDPLDKKVRAKDFPEFEVYPSYLLRYFVQVANDPNDRTFEACDTYLIRSGEFKGKEFYAACHEIKQDFDPFKPDKRPIRQALGLPFEITTPKEKRSRMQQILEWTGPNFDGVIALDESHFARNSVEM